MLQQKLTKGEAVWKRKSSVLVMKWKDKRDVYMITTGHKYEMDTSSSKRGNPKRKPKCVLDYNAYMSGIDRADQMTSDIIRVRETLRCYRKKK